MVANFVQPDVDPNQRFININRTIPVLRFGQIEIGDVHPIQASRNRVLPKMFQRLLNRDISIRAPLLHDRSPWTAWNDEPESGRSAPDAHVGLAVAVVVALHRNVTQRRGAPLLYCRSPGIAAGIDVPSSSRSTPHSDVGLPIAVVVARYGDVAQRRGTPLLYYHSPGIAAGIDVPSSSRSTPYSDVGLPIAVVVARYGNVTQGRGTPLLYYRSSGIAAENDEPDPIRGSPHRKVCLAVGVEVATDRDSES